jgi:hypothetical protein
MDLVRSWYCTQEARLGEPVLVLRTLDGREMAFMLPMASAERLGLALLAESRQAAPKGLPN